MTYHRHLTLGLALGAIVAAGPAWADGSYRHGSGHHAMSRHGGHSHTQAGGHILRHVFKHKQELGLSDEQITKLRTMALDADRAGIRADADVAVSERELRAMLWDKQAELPAIEAKVKEHKAFEATARIIGIKARRDLLSVLSEEQRSKLKALWHQRRQGYSGHTRAQGGEVAKGEETREAGPENFDLDLAELMEESSAG